MNGSNWILPSMARRPGVCGRRCLGVPKDDLLKAGVSEVAATLLCAMNPGSEKRTRLDRLVPGVFTVSDAARGLTGDEKTSCRRFCLRSAIGTSKSEDTAEAISGIEFIDIATIPPRLQ